VVDPTAPIETTSANIAKVRGVAVPEQTVCILDRARHEADLVRRIRDAGSRSKFLLDGDVAGAIMAANPDTNIDLMVGVGGTPEGALAACALKCLGGAAFYGRLHPRNDDERRRALDAGYDVEAVLTLNDMVRSDNVFVAATGVTDGEMLRGVYYSPHRATTHSISMRSLSGAVRLIETRDRISTSNLIPEGDTTAQPVVPDTAKPPGRRSHS
jgi:fructose-1,6-bisphosphatase II